jgi:hypothetical protein
LKKWWSEEQDNDSGVRRTLRAVGSGASNHGGADIVEHSGSHDGSARTTAVKSGTAGIGASVPSWRLAEESQRRRAAEAKVKGLEDRIAAEAVQRSHRQERVWRRNRKPVTSALPK